MKKLLTSILAFTILTIQPSVFAEAMYLEGTQVPGYIENVIDPIIIPKDAPAELNAFASKLGENATLQGVVNALMFTGRDENGRGIYSYNQGLVQAKELGLTFDDITAFARKNGVNTLFTIYLRNELGYVVTFSAPAIKEVEVKEKEEETTSTQTAEAQTSETMNTNVEVKEAVVGTVEAPVFYSGTFTKAEAQGKGFASYYIEYEQGKQLLVMSGTNLDEYLGQEVGIDTLGTKESFSILNTYVKQGDEFVKLYASDTPAIVSEEKEGFFDNIFSNESEENIEKPIQEATGAEVLPAAGISTSAYIIFAIVTALAIIFYYVFRRRRPYY